MISVFAPSPVDHCFEPQSSQTRVSKWYVLPPCLANSFQAREQRLLGSESGCVRHESKDCLTQNQDNVSGMRADCLAQNQDNVSGMRADCLAQNQDNVSGMRADCLAQNQDNVSGMRADCLAQNQDNVSGMRVKTAWLRIRIMCQA